jgi:hypothetical protein
MPQYPYNEPVGLSYKHVVNAATTTVKAGPGYLDRIVYNSGSSAATLTLYDNTAGSGTIIGVVTLSASENTPSAVVYNVTFSTGLVVVSTGTVDCTIVFR